MLKWSRQHDGTWRTSDGYGALIIQHSRKTKRWYLLRDKFGQDLQLLADYATRAEAQKAAEPRQQNPKRKIKRKKNPGRRAARREFIERGAKLYEDFSGHRAKIVGRTRKPKIPDVLVNVGVIDFIGYTTVRDGKREEYIHKFKRSAKPLFCVTPDGDHIFLLEGKYDFTEAGIIDRS